MKLLLINSVCGIKSTGRICTDIAKTLEEKGHEVKIAYGREEVPEEYKKYAVRIGSGMDVIVHGIKTRLFDSAGFGSRRATKAFIKWLKKYDPDIIHLHNIHGYYIDIEVLFDYLRTCNKKIIWTMHDCWSFTGHCAYFEYVDCDHWRSGCRDCKQKISYPMSFTDYSTKNWMKKKKCFSDIPNMTMITPSKWLAKLTKESYMGSYQIKVINNGIDINRFRYVKSNIKERYHIANKKVILCVAAVWDKRKGLEYIEKLAELASEEYQIVVIGVTKWQKRLLSKKIIGILRTNSVEELVEWYSAAEVFVNPTLEDNYPTTNLEAIACDTPVITFKSGGSVESAEIFGTSVMKGDVDGLREVIKSNEFKKQGDVPTKEDMVNQYMELYFEE